MKAAFTIDSFPRNSDLFGGEVWAQLVGTDIMIKGGQGILAPGTLVDATGTKTSTATATFGILGFWVDTSQGDQGRCVYKAGTFARGVIEAVNQKSRSLDLALLGGEPVFKPCLDRDSLDRARPVW